MRANRLHAFLRGRREHLDLSQEVVAERLGISTRSYWSWERGRVKEWTDQKLHALATALEMSPFQTERLFWCAAGRAPQLPGTGTPVQPSSRDTAATAFLDDYRTMMNALALPTFVIDRQWDIKMANTAYRDLFSEVRPHPTAMPSDNFLRFGLFHPDAQTVLVDHATWQMAMLAQLSSSLERHDAAVLQTIRRDVYRHPALRDAYLNDMPTWVLGCGADLVHYEGTVRELRHPNPQIGLQGCRLVEETPRFLQTLGLTRITLVLIEPDETFADVRLLRGHDHHAA
ncbi:helix-turn-helix transcriptional regulator (plasmid) [Streptomyces sp. NBC_01281]|uniref:helix-turn-helix domain-containing protein n=1 Tax=Streptomyces sp. NBC_01281 TaxID=2903811 RepID=UPI002E13202A|nr:helix-turn-helix transcriptional regulator [Streptomyces sp. NBC_01281]